MGKGVVKEVGFPTVTMLNHITVYIQEIIAILQIKGYDCKNTGPEHGDYAVIITSVGIWIVRRTDAGVHGGASSGRGKGERCILWMRGGGAHGQDG